MQSDKMKEAQQAYLKELEDLYFVHPMRISPEERTEQNAAIRAFCGLAVIEDAVIGLWYNLPGCIDLNSDGLHGFVVSDRNMKEIFSVDYTTHER